MIGKIPLLLLVLLASAEIISLQKEKTVLQSDHFYSQSETTKEFQINQAKIGRPLIMILKEKSQRNYDIAANSVNVALMDQNQTASCQFQSYRHLCVIQQVQDTIVNAVISCQRAPCDVSWVVYQLEFGSIQSDQLAQGLFALQQSNDHLITTITCNDPAIKYLGEDIKVYSDSNYESGGTASQVYFLFKNVTKGYILVDIKQQSKQCSHISFITTPQRISYSQTTFRDFTNKDSPFEVRLNLPKSDFRMDGQFNRLDIFDQHPFETTIHLFGVPKQGEWVLLSKNVIGPRHSDIEIRFSVTFKKPEDQYEELALKIVNDNLEMTVVTFVINQHEVQQVELGEINYFNLRQGEGIFYKLIQEQAADPEDKVYFHVEKDSNVTISQEQCATKAGCQFALEAVNDTTGFIYFSGIPQNENQLDQIAFLPIAKSVTRKIRDNVHLYFKKQVKAKKAFEVTVNSPNVLIYASSQKNCWYPNEQCYDRTGNYHNPFVYTPSEDGFFLFNVEGLDSGEFTLTIIEEDDEFLPLTDGVPFSYTMDPMEDKISFKFVITEKKDVTFNLIAPLNNVLLKVTNSMGANQESNWEVSTDGFLVFSQNDMEFLQFAIDVQKTSLSQGKFTHFTIIASTGDVAIRLESAVTHYQTLPATAAKEYIFEYDPTEEYLINFYSHNLQESNTSIAISLAFSSDREWKNNLDKMWIDREADYLDLGYISKNLCKSKGAESCEIFMRIQNEMPIVVDITITLMVHNSIIELKDGIWQSYSENAMAASAHFYFYPKHYNKDMTLMFWDTHQALQLHYSLWKTDSKSFNPAEWPFPEAPLYSEESYKLLNHVLIEKSVLQSECEPNCVVLITLYRIEHSNPFVQDQGHFMIMASNNQIELPENTRINLSLKQNENKQVMVDLKYALNSKFITFYASHLLGRYEIQANVYSSNNPRCPSQGNADYQLTNGETDIDVDQLKLLIANQGMQADTDFYLCLSIDPLENSKLSLEYTTAMDIESSYKKVHMNSFEDIQLQKGDKKIYQVDGNVDFSAKIMRKRGYPYVYIGKCLLSKLKDCRNSIIVSQDKGRQLVSKTEQFNEEPCEDCVYFFKFQAEEPGSLSLRLQSKYSQIEVKENQILTDFISQSRQSRYLITSIIGLDLVVNIHVQEGDLEARLTDARGDFSLVKESTADNKLIHFYISAAQLKEKDDQPVNKRGEFGMNPYMFSRTFNNFHLLLSRKQNATCTFSITYSSGESKVFLQDGLITDLTLHPNNQTSFYFTNERKSSDVYLIISLLTGTEFGKIGIKGYYFEEGLEANKTEFALVKPETRKKTPKPTLLFELPPKSYIVIVIANLQSEDMALSIGINHQEVVLLPFSHEYPFILHSSQEINFLVEVGQPGFIEVTIRKCDESDPTFSYAYNYESFIKNEFANQIALNDDPTFQYLIKIDAAGTFYANFKSSPTDSSLLSILLQFYLQRPNRQILKAGHKGVIDYEILDNKRAEIVFAPVVCISAKCPKISYYTMNAKKKEDLYSQLVCLSNYFSSLQLTTTAPIALDKIEYTEGSTSIRYTSDLVDHISFVGVKAVEEEGGREIYYRPVEVVTFWGQLSRTNQNHLITIVVIVSVLIVSLLFYVRYSARKGYRPIGQDSQGAAETMEVAEPASGSALQQSQNDI